MSDDCHFSPLGARTESLKSQIHFLLLILIALVSAANSVAQTASNINPPAQIPGVENEQLSKGARADLPSSTTSTKPQPFRVQRITIDGGSELLTVFGRMDGLPGNDLAKETPLVSVVRDTLGDNDPDNDRLRYVWMLTFTEPTLKKRIAAAIPFLYQHVGNKTRASAGPPPTLIDLANPNRSSFREILWTALQNLVLDHFGMPLRASSRTYRRNFSDYHSAHLTQALTVLSAFERWRQTHRDESEFLASLQPSLTSDSIVKTRAAVDAPVESPVTELAPGFTNRESLELRALLIRSGQTYRSLLSRESFHDTVARDTKKTIDIAGHNWELLRQRAEAEGLYFEPLMMPDGSVSHAMLWISRKDIVTQFHRHFNGRFMNVADPWTDNRLRTWHGFTQIRYLDSNGSVVSAGDAAAQPVEMIPLALYGLDHPKIPILLVDFRDSLNPKKREMTRRVLRDVAKNVFSFSGVSDAMYFAARKPFDWLTGRRGMDLNQPSRLRSYSELKLLLAFNGSINPGLKTEIERRLENVSLNPLSNDGAAEISLARQQYDSLIRFARRPGGLPAKIERDRRAEMVSLEHGRAARFFFGLGNLLTFGRYIHREDATPELSARLDLARRVRTHTEFLLEVAQSSPQIEVVWDMQTVMRSLKFLAANGSAVNKSGARAAAQIFARTNDSEARRVCLDALLRINNQTARDELHRLYENEAPASEWRARIAESLQNANANDGKTKPAQTGSTINQSQP